MKPCAKVLLSHQGHVPQGTWPLLLHQLFEPCLLFYSSLLLYLLFTSMSAFPRSFLAFLCSLLSFILSPNASVASIPHPHPDLPPLAAKDFGCGGSGLCLSGKLSQLF